MCSTAPGSCGCSVFLSHMDFLGYGVWFILCAQSVEICVLSSVPEFIPYSQSVWIHGLSPLPRFWDPWFIPYSQKSMEIFPGVGNWDLLCQLGVHFPEGIPVGNSLNSLSLSFSLSDQIQATSPHPQTIIFFPLYPRNYFSPSVQHGVQQRRQRVCGRAHGQREDHLCGVRHPAHAAAELRGPLRLHHPHGGPGRAGGAGGALERGNSWFIQPESHRDRHGVCPSR